MGERQDSQLLVVEKIGVGKGGVRGRKGNGETSGIVCTDFLLTLPFSDSWLSGSLLAASSEGGVDAESDSFFVRATGMKGSEDVGVCTLGEMRLRRRKVRNANANAIRNGRKPLLRENRKRMS